MYIICIYVDIVTVCHRPTVVVTEKRLRGGGCFELSPEHRGFQVTCGVDQTGMAEPKKGWLLTGENPGKSINIYL